MNFIGHWASATGIARIVARTPTTLTRDTNSHQNTIVLNGHWFATDEQVARTCDTISRTNDIDLVNGWPGCCSMMLITGSSATLLTDPVGQFPFYVAEKAGDIWFGTHSSDIARHTGSPLDKISLTSVLACPEVSELAHGRSMYRGVRRITAGRILSIGPRGLREREHSSLRAAPGSTLTDSADRLRLSLSNAVRVRATLPDRVTSDLSGGLDSSSIALLASEYIDGELPVLTYENPMAPVTDDLAHARRHVRLARGLRQHLIRADPEHLPYQTLGPIGDLPHGSQVAMGTLRARLRCAAELGSRIHLIGEGGDVLLSAPPAYLADLARRGELARLWRHCTAWARLRGRSPLALFRRAVLLGGTTRRKALGGLAAQVNAGRPVKNDSWEHDRIAYWPRPHSNWLTPSARRSLAAHIQDTAERLPVEHDLGVGDVVTLEWIRQQTLTLSTVRAVGADFGIEVHAPFMDTEVVKACLSLPAFRRADPTTPKPLLRAALAGIVPHAVLSRTTKGDYTRDAYLGVRRAAPKLRRMLSESAAADHGVLEPGPVREVLEAAIQGLPTPWGALNQVFAVEAWLRQHEKGGSP
jgi:asparagine synthase (glutamine-hydrolysing)